jgi:polysaccharide pyruvyl transferase CsaB
MYGAGNLGDDLLMESVHGVLAAAGQRVTTAAHRPYPVNWARDSLVPTPTLSRRFIQDLGGYVRALREADMLVVGGGGLFQDTHYEHTVATYSLALSLAVALGKGVIVWGVGVGPFRRASNRNLTARALALTDEVTVRDPNSVSALGPAWTRRTRVVSDAAWWLERSAGALGERERPTIGLILRHWPRVDDVALAKAVADVARRRSMRVYFIPFEYSAEIPRDLKQAERLRDIMRNAGLDAVVPVPPDYPSLEPTLRALQACDGVLTMRFHGALLALRERVPVCALACSPKIRELLVQGGLDERVVPVEAPATEIAQALERVVAAGRAAVAEQEPARARYIETAGDGAALREAMANCATPTPARRARAAALALECALRIGGAVGALTVERMLLRVSPRG